MPPISIYIRQKEHSPPSRFSRPPPPSPLCRFSLYLPRPPFSYQYTANPPITPNELFVRPSPSSSILSVPYPPLSGFIRGKVRLARKRFLYYVCGVVRCIMSEW